MNLDPFDRRILGLVQEDASLTGEKLSESVALSVTALQRRLRRLHEVGVIQRNVAIVDPQRVGRPTFFVVTSPAFSSTPTCFFMPVSVMWNFSASSEIDASSLPSCSSTPRRVASESAAKDASR